ncbi:WD repeat domain-containing protein 83-like [Phoenix dactylifera]|uniref:WD repeat domain-containing protein 83-like n=1 Tax=Phoenix dactylifera TaxID=42345 RepID=A0A8B8J1V7_PHODC|nr:WD repeat domain-containing protein 83-like [Phoenix dactylifera]
MIDQMPIFRSPGELLQEYKGHTCKSYKMNCCPTNTDAHVAGGFDDGFIFFWDLVDASVVSRFRAHASVSLYAWQHKTT